MKQKLIALLFIATIYSCHKNGLLSQAEESKILNELHTEIQELAQREACTDAGEWAYTAIGAKACGGPAAYIAYPLRIDTERFLKKVEQYTTMQDNYNTKWKIISDCALTPQPTGVECVQGTAQLIY